MENTALLLVVTGLLFPVFRWCWASNVLNLPTVGYDGPVLSYFSAMRFLREADVVIQAGYNQYRNKLFKVPLMDRWLVIATGSELIESIRSAPEHVLSMEAATNDLIQTEYTLGSEFSQNPYHLSAIRSSLNKSLGTLMPDMLDEIICSFGDEIDSKFKNDGWKTVPAVDTFTRIVCRVINRIFVGLPICRNIDYCNLNTRFAINVIIGGAVVNLFPEFAKPFVGNIVSRLSGHQHQMLMHVGPLIKERQEWIAEYGPNYPDKPNDLISWLMEAASPGAEPTAESLAIRILNVNFVALHSTAMSFVQALFCLASKPEYIPILLAEVKDCLGLRPKTWTEENLEKCWKLDSFLKECLRLNSLAAVTMPRKALVPFTFSDGTTIPVGTIVAAASLATHVDEDVYERGSQFDAFRFSDIRERSVATGEVDASVQGDKASRACMTSVGPSYLSFGGGRHLCPGRFFAAIEMKSMLAYLVLNYEVKMEQEGVKPRDEWFGVTCVPNRRAHVLFRLRSDGSFQDM